jgi:hypothetical protein
MNWGRGFYRVWIVLAVLWAGFLLSLAVLLRRAGGGMFDDLIPYTPDDQLVAAALWVAGPPIGLRMVGLLMTWVLRGFLS